MSGLIVVVVFCSGGISAAALRIKHRREQRERFTREWIEYIQQDVAASSL